ncbi:DUF4132 domain-containing protein [Kribbella sp. NPDC051587]|uniref:DUF4132 domain-containing protein n=1 Tax=Kribbella sp. NPDC051587 TaxID=3364119 RepID=UPI0037ADA093
MTPLYKAMEPVAAGDTRLHQALVDYVLTGSPQSVLHDVASYHAASHLALLRYHHGDSDAQRALEQFVAQLPEMPDEVTLRWAQLLTAALNGTPDYVPSDLVGRPIWPEALVLHLGHLMSHRYGTPEIVLAGLDHPWLERLLAAQGLDPAAVLVAAFRIPVVSADYYPTDERVVAVRSMAGYDEAVRRHTAVLRAGIELDKIAGQQSLLQMLRPAEPLSSETLAGFASEIAIAAASTSAAVRDRAKPLLSVEGVTEGLRVVAEQGKPDQRLQALKLLLATEDAEVQQWALGCAAADRAEKVRELAAAWSPPEERVVAEVVPADLRVRVTPELRARLTELFAVPPRYQQPRGQDRPPTDDELRRVLDALETGHFRRGPDTQMRPWSWADQVIGPRAAELGPVVVTVIYAATGLLQDTYHGWLSNGLVNHYSRFFLADGRPTLLEIASLLDAVGADGRGLVLKSNLTYYSPIRLGHGWPEEAVAPFALAVLPKLLELAERAENVTPFDLLATIPVLPKPAVDALLELAVGSRKAQRPWAQSVLEKTAGFEELVIGALKSGKADTRIVAAQWLQRLGYQGAVPALEVAVAKEKNELVKGTLIDTLESLGQPIEEYLDRDGLARQAEVGLAKGLPKDLAWLNWETVPVVHWTDSGAEVPRPVLQWLAAQAVRAKSSEPNVLLRKYCGLFVPAEREAFGQYLLEAWLAQDVAVVSAEEALQRAEQEATQLHRWHTLYPQSYNHDPLFGLNQADIAGRLLPSTSTQLAGSAASSKGLLAVVAACAGAGAAAPVGRYLKQWFGTRSSQGKALIGMLAWIDHPSAIQLMLSVGSRFRTKSFQDEANRQAAALAERNGWTVDELADRSVPVAGFDEDGRIELSYGDRVFTAELQADLTIRLVSPEGKTIKALPAARQSDDADAVKAAKKSLTAAKRELKSVVELQSSRLYEALCTERTWPAEDWQRYLNGHPIMRRLVQRLAWIADGKVVFRPLEDGTLTDADDEPVELAGDEVVRLAHDTLLTEDVVQAWQAHFADYEVVPLFQQFGKGIFRLPPERADSTYLGDFEGHLVESLALRGRTTKLGYLRGTPQDAGWFYEYEKRFSSLGLTIVVDFTGNVLPEENRTVALRGLRIVRATPDQYGGGVLLRLGDVPAVLLSEAYNDLRLMASDGTGFDPDWEKKSEY